MAQRITVDVERLHTATLSEGMWRQRGPPLHLFLYTLHPQENTDRHNIHDFYCFQDQVIVVDRYTPHVEHSEHKSACRLHHEKCTTSHTWEYTTLVSNKLYLDVKIISLTASNFRSCDPLLVPLLGPGRALAEVHMWRRIIQLLELCCTQAVMG
jgi:hypothetical protein